MFVIKRNGNKEKVLFDKITLRISKLINDDELLDPIPIAKKVINSIYSGITTEELDLESAKICSNMVTTNPLYGLLAGRIVASNLHKKTSADFVETMNTIQKDCDILDVNLLEWLNSNKEAINSMIDYERDYLYDYFGFKTLERSYLLKNQVTGSIYERPQHTFMRVASHICCGNLEKIKITYDLLSTKAYTHASPTLFNAGTKRPQLSSCFLLNTNDCIEGITTTWDRVARISKWAGGIGLHVSNIRGKNSIIRGTNGTSAGIIPMLQVYNNIARYINQGGKRKGSIAIYLEPHHIDILDFLDLRKNTGVESERARDLFLALWISDLFMEQVEKDSDWYLMCPDESVGLTEVYGEEYNLLYWKYVAEKKYKVKMSARKLMEHIMDSQLETGTPYMLYKDSINKKSNQKNIGIIKSSNLCVSYDTHIMTRNGSYMIGSMEGMNVDIWNGFEFSPVTIHKTGINVNMMKVEFSNGEELVCTPEHKFYTNNIIVRTKDLQIGMTIIDYNYPIVSSSSVNSNNIIPYNNISSNNIIPYNNNVTTKLKWLETIIDKDGCLTSNNDSYTLYITTTNGREIRRLINSLGADCKYDTNNITISHNNICKLLNVGLNILNLKKLRIIEENSSIYITNITDNYIVGDTYCFTENKRNMGMFNGIVTGQCAEIVEVSNDEEHAVCNLASICINKFLKPFKNEKKWTIYTKDNCTYCKWAKNYITHKGYNMITKKVSSEELKQIVPNNNDTITFPQLFYGDTHIGGFNDMIQFTADEYDYSELWNTAYIATINLNQVIDINYYPTEETKCSNMRNRPIGLGIQGLADTLVCMKIPFESDLALNFNRIMMETIYNASLTASMNIAHSRYEQMKILIETLEQSIPEYYDNNFKLDNDKLNTIYHNLRVCKRELSLTSHYGAYSSYIGSALYEGMFQFDMWEGTNTTFMSGMYDWDNLRNGVNEYGVRNSLLVALMPTATTSQIMGNNECFEWFTSNIYTRRTLAGDFPIVNKHLVNDLLSIGEWNENTKQIIIASDGNIEHLSIPSTFKNLYKTIWDIKQIWVLKHALARAPFVDQTQSMNIFMAVPDYNKLLNCHMWAWKNGLKTGMYYLRTKPAESAVKVTVDPNIIKKIDNNNDICDTCSA